MEINFTIQVKSLLLPLADSIFPAFPMPGNVWILEKAVNHVERA